ncbi:MAG: cytochrome C [Oligoflexia bacterium]|nr:cytochrome C [Oligoflexia bacterium]
MKTLPRRGVIGSFLFFALLAGPMLPAQAQEDEEPRCGECHAEVKPLQDKHEDQRCIDCHTNIKDIPGPRTPGMKNPHPASPGFEPLASQAMCRQCHEEVEELIGKSNHEELSCKKCHGSIHRGFVKEGSSSCISCHKEENLAFRGDVHQTNDTSCRDCHGRAHKITDTRNVKSPVSAFRQPEVCGECHDKELIHAYRESGHGKGVFRSGLAVAPTCSTCHGSHGIHVKDDSRSKISTKQVPKTCGQCHEFVLDKWTDSVHGQIWKEGKDAPTCINCHSPHPPLKPGETAVANGVRMTIPEKCGECHKREVTTYRDSFHGKATSLGFLKAASCSDCHTPHDILRKDDKRSSTHPSRVQKTCASCHGTVTAAFAQFDPHLDPTDPKDNPPIHYAWLFMTVLLVGTFAFFAIHTVLWLQRAVVAFKRHEFHRHAYPLDQQWVRRFRPVHRWVHLTIIITFLLLAFTGLPLKFHYVNWAVALSNVVGGIDVARILHRLAGVVTFGYAIFFVLYLFTQIVLKRQWHLLWGWRSMVPNKKDLIDFRDNIRWFLYLGPPPRLDRWTYWEKFDFFAVFWGVPVIGLSGLMLWFPEAVTQVLPGWALNLAYIVHSDEALLATGFIFFFHFFHTHLRPENFPLDPVMFTGSLPLERFKEERPAEYERLSKSGELQKLLVAPPSARFLHRARVFGFIALGIGVLLGILLVAGGIKALIGH